MSIIAVRGFPVKVSLMDVIKTLAKPINGPFEALCFKTPKGQPKLKPKIKTCYLRLSEKLDPVGVVEKINYHNYKSNSKLRASIPDNVPDLHVGLKPKKLPVKLRMALQIPDMDPFEAVIKMTEEEVLAEVQARYPGLFSLSFKTGHKLLREISKKIFSRLKELADSSTETGSSCFKLSRAYRRVHPHFGDFQLVLSTLHSIQDAAGTPRTQLEETELAATPPPQGLDISNEKANQISSKYAEKIHKKMADHIIALHSDVTQLDTEEEIARKQVRVELKKMLPFLSQIVHSVVSKQLNPKDGPFHRMKIYGEPFLPSKETMSPFLSRYKPVHVLRSTRMFNLLKFSVPPVHYHTLVAMNGTVLNGAKLTIRSSEMPRYKVEQSSELDAVDTIMEDEIEQLEDYAMD